MLSIDSRLKERILPKRGNGFHRDSRAGFVERFLIQKKAFDMNHNLTFIDHPIERNRA